MASLLSFSSLTNKPGIPTRVPAKPAATISSSSAALATETLNQKFGRKGIQFIDNGGGVAIIELSVRNGSSVRLGVADAHVTSYKPKVYWKDDGFEEILYSLPPEAASTSARGGIGLVLNVANETDITTPSATKGLKGDETGRGGQYSVLSDAEWSVKDVDSDSYDAVQVELSCTTFGGTLDITYVISLYPVSLATAVLVKNNGRKPINITSAILSHLKSQKREGTAIKGLQGCPYCAHPPLSSPFQLLSPAEAMKADDDAGNWFASSGSAGASKPPGVWTEQVEPFTILKNKISRLYAAPLSERSKRFYRTPPSKFETIDQGKELFYRVIRMGYEDIYVASPGSYSTRYGTDYFICAGPASMLVPVTISPSETWRGAQVIEHDNLN